MLSRTAVRLDPRPRGVSRTMRIASASASRPRARVRAPPRPPTSSERVPCRGGQVAHRSVAAAAAPAAPPVRLAGELMRCRHVATPYGWGLPLPALYVESPATPAINTANRPNASFRVFFPRARSRSTLPASACSGSAASATRVVPAGGPSIFTMSGRWPASRGPARTGADPCPVVAGSRRPGRCACVTGRRRVGAVESPPSVPVPTTVLQVLLHSRHPCAVRDRVLHYGSGS